MFWLTEAAIWVHWFSINRARCNLLTVHAFCALVNRQFDRFVPNRQPYIFAQITITQFQNTHRMHIIMQFQPEHNSETSVLWCKNLSTLHVIVSDYSPLNWGAEFKWPSLSLAHEKIRIPSQLYIFSTDKIANQTWSIVEKCHSLIVSKI